LFFGGFNIDANERSDATEHRVPDAIDVESDGTTG
jgi:hypothetical protein